MPIILLQIGEMWICEFRTTTKCKTKKLKKTLYMQISVNGSGDGITRLRLHL